MKEKEEILEFLEECLLILDKLSKIKNDSVQVAPIQLEIVNLFLKVYQKGYDKGFKKGKKKRELLNEGTNLTF